MASTAGWVSYHRTTVGDLPLGTLTPNGDAELVNKDFPLMDIDGNRRPNGWSWRSTKKRCSVFSFTGKGEVQHCQGRDRSIPRNTIEHRRPIWDPVTGTWSYEVIEVAKMGGTR